MSPGAGTDSASLAKVIKLIKARGEENQTQYQKDLLKWASNVDKRYAWVVLFALWVIMVSCLGPYRIYGLVFAKVTAEGVYTREEATWPVSMIFTVENILGPLVSIITYRISPRGSMFVGGFLLTIANILSYWSDSLLVDVILIGFVQGIGFSFIFMPFMSIINNYFIRYRNIALGFALCGGTLSVFVWSPIFRWVLDTFHWRTSYLGLGFVCSPSILIVWLLRPNPQPDVPSEMKSLVEAANNNDSKFKRLSRRALSYQNSIRRQSTILVARRGIDRQASIVSVNPFASSVGLERKISRVITDSIDQQDLQLQQANLSQYQKQAISKQTSVLTVMSHLDPHETMSLSEIVEDESAGDFELSVIWDILKTPGFHVIWCLELIYYWIFSIYCLVLVDYGTDRGCTRDEAESLLMYQSVGEILGRMILTILVDMRFLSNQNVVKLVLFILTCLLVAVTQIEGFIAMAALTVLVNAFASLLYILLNGLLVDFLGERHVTIGYGMASCVVGALILFRPQAVGYFRDIHGSYDLLMISMGAACAIGAILCILEPLLTRWLRKDKSAKFDTNSIENNDV